VLNWTPQTRGWGASRRGNEHARNEDAFILLDHPSRTRNVTDKGAIYVVSDGVSTVAEGHWASHLTISRMNQFFEASNVASVETMTQLLSEIDWEIRGERKGRAACTVAAAWVYDGRVYVFQVGDSHIFRVRNGKVERLTATETKGGRKLDHFLGMGPAVSEVIHVAEHLIETGDALVLVTDGVTEHVSDDALVTYWDGANGDPAACTQAILGAVSRAQGGDDATVIAALVL
jgi:serine/threonine protein phosphatase PrpC